MLLALGAGRPPSGTKTTLSSSSSSKEKQNMAQIRPAVSQKKEEVEEGATHLEREYGHKDVRTKGQMQTEHVIMCV